MDLSNDWMLTVWEGCNDDNVTLLYAVCSSSARNTRTGGLRRGHFLRFLSFHFSFPFAPFSLPLPLSIYSLPLSFTFGIPCPLRPLSAGVLDHERSYRVKERRSERGKKKADTFSDFFRVSFSFPFSPFSLSSSATAMLSLSPMDLKKVSLGGIFSVVSPVISSVLLFCASLTFFSSVVPSSSSLSIFQVDSPSGPLPLSVIS